MQVKPVKVMSQMAGALAHEINQPLTVIIGNVELLIKYLEPSDPILDDLQHILNAGLRIRDCVKKIQNVQRYVTRPYIKNLEIIDIDRALCKGNKNE